MKTDAHTFKHDGDTVQVYPISPAEFLVASYSGEVDVKGRAAVMDKSDAAEIMLAVAESAGIIPTHSDSWTVGEPDNLARIAADLQHHIERRDARTKEAADREALEADAWELYKVRSPGTAYESFRDMPDVQRADWVRTAKFARELYGGTK